MSLVHESANGAVLWEPAEVKTESSAIGAFVRWLADQGFGEFATYRDLHTWSIEHRSDFWTAITRYFEVPVDGRARALDMPPNDGDWFPGSQLNYAAKVLEVTRDGLAIVMIDESGERVTWTWAQLRGEVSAFAAKLRQLEIGPGDVVAAYVSNTPEAVAAFLGAAAVGATWAACGQEYGVDAALARLGPLSPRILLAGSGYQFGGRYRSRVEQVEQVANALPELAEVIWSQGHGSPNLPGVTCTRWEDMQPSSAATSVAEVPFNHPLWVLFTSGTTGPPKGVVHSHGGALIEHLKYISFHTDLGPQDKFFWYTSPSWVVWNTVVSSLQVGATAVLYNGSPKYPDAERLWRIAEAEKLDVLGVSAAYIGESHAAGISLSSIDSSHLRAVHVTGSPLSDELARWASAGLGGTVPVVSVSGGTDIITGLISGNAMTPLYSDRLAAPCLGVAVEAWGDEGQSLTDEPGELVVTRAMPSMPLGLWNDNDNQRFRESYFEKFPGVWSHGDWITVHRAGGVTIHGRSDAVINRNGIRFGTIEVYAALDDLRGLNNVIAIGVEVGAGKYWFGLMVELEPEVKLTGQFRQNIVDHLSTRASPRHVPDDIIQVRHIPLTMTEKKLEVPLKRAILGRLGVVPAGPTPVCDDLPAFNEATDRCVEAIRRHVKKIGTK